MGIANCSDKIMRQRQARRPVSTDPIPMAINSAKDDKSFSGNGPLIYSQTIAISSRQSYVITLPLLLSSFKSSEVLNITAWFCEYPVEILP